jgi:PPOX class probable F420-dependent enzyme
VSFTDKQRFELLRESILWVTTVKPNGQPQTLPVWFIVDGDDLIIWSMKGARSRNLETNPLVSAHISDDGRGSRVLSIEGTASIEPELGLPGDNSSYVDRYQGLIDEYEMTWDTYNSQYNIPVRIRPTKVRSD